MGGFFGVTSHADAMSDVFFGVDYHSHLGTSRGGMAAYDPELGIQSEIHNIQNSPFRTKFENVFDALHGNSVIGVISDAEPQPLIIRAGFGAYAICGVGIIRNWNELLQEFLTEGKEHFNALSGGRINPIEMLAALINRKESIAEGIEYAWEKIEGTMAILILKDDGHIIAARDKWVRLPVHIGMNETGHCVSFESFAYQKLGYVDYKELGPGEIVELTKDEVITLKEANEEMRICAFLWSYYGYPNSNYEGVNVEEMRYRNGEIMARNDKEAGLCEGIDNVCGIPDSGTPHAIGYSNATGIKFSSPFIKYTPTWPRSFMPPNQSQRNKVARMKQVPVPELIKHRSLLFVDDSIVRGTQLKETVDFLYQNGAEQVHMRSACPPIMYGCKFLNFSSSKNEMELLARRVIIELEGEEGLNHISEYSDSKTERGQKLRKTICEMYGFESLEFQSLEGVVEAIGLPKCRLCTYCWDGKE